MASIPSFPVKTSKYTSQHTIILNLKPLPKPIRVRQSAGCAIGGKGRQKHEVQTLYQARGPGFRHPRAAVRGVSSRGRHRPSFYPGKTMCLLKIPIRSPVIRGQWQLRRLNSPSAPSAPNSLLPSSNPDFLPILSSFSRPRIVAFFP